LHSRMTNGTVQQGGNSTLVIRYQDGVPVTLVAKEKVNVGSGDTVYAVTEKLPVGTLTTNKIFQVVAASAGNAQ